jgi:hypothetical protein
VSRGQRGGSLTTVNLSFLDRSRSVFFLVAPQHRVLRRIFWSKGDGVMGGWRNLYNEELHNLYSSQSKIRIIKSRRKRWAGHVAQMGEKRTV